MPDNNSDYTLQHVGTGLTRQSDDPAAPLEGKAVFVAFSPTIPTGTQQPTHTAGKAELTNFLRLANITEMLGYKMPVSSVSFTVALATIHAMEIMGKPVDNMILDLKLPANTMNRFVPSA